MYIERGLTLIKSSPRDSYGNYRQLSSMIDVHYDIEFSTYDNFTDGKMGTLTSIKNFMNLTRKMSLR